MGSKRTPTVDEIDTSLFNWDDKPPNACVRYRSCGNRVPANGQMCAECLDEVRHDESA